MADGAGNPCPIRKSARTLASACQPLAAWGLRVAGSVCLIGGAAEEPRAWRDLTILTLDGGRRRGQRRHRRGPAFCAYCVAETLVAALGQTRRRDALAGGDGGSTVLRCMES
jgi:hypothetical protein